MIETSGVIEKEQGNGFYLVTLEQPEGHQCLCRAAGKLTKFRIKLLAGDKVLVEISPYDLSRGRITYRERNAGGAKPTTNKTTFSPINPNAFCLPSWPIGCVKNVFIKLPSLSSL